MTPLNPQRTLQVFTLTTEDPKGPIAPTEVPRGPPLPTEDPSALAMEDHPKDWCGSSPLDGSIHDPDFLEGKCLRFFKDASVPVS